MNEKQTPHGVLVQVWREHRTDRAWSFGYGEDFGAPPNTAGADCRCGKRFLRYDRDADAYEEWEQHWAEESLAALADAGYAVVPVEPTDAMVEAMDDALLDACDRAVCAGDTRLHPANPIWGDRAEPPDDYDRWCSYAGVVVWRAALAAVGTEPREES